MIYDYQYSSTNKLHGILRFFFDKGTEIYENVLKYHGTSVSQQYYVKYAFNFDNDKYWIGRTDENDFTNLTFCLNNYYVKISGFEISTSNGGATLPKKFAFSSSMNNETYSNLKDYEYSFRKADIHYFPYNNKVSNCFKLICIESIDGYSVFDVNNIEIYGIFSSNRDV